MSVQYEQSQEGLCQKYALSDDSKKGSSAIPVRVVSPSTGSKNSLMKDKFSDDSNKIGFLNQCKLELSAEVIKWKEENHKLRREKEAFEQKISELQIVLDKLSRRNVELESGLHSLNQDYEKLKMHSLAVNEENKYLHRKLSKTCTKYYSYPWSEFGASPAVPYVNGTIPQLPKTDVDVTRGWEEVSEKLIEQMKLEMKELQELGQKLAINELPSNTGDQTISTLKDRICSEQIIDGSDVENSIIDMTCDLESLQQCLKGQQQKLSLLLSRTPFGFENHDISSDKITHHVQNSVPENRKGDSACSLTDWETSDASGRKFVRPSDDSFRAYFTQQLSNSKSTEELKRMMNLYLDSSKDFLSESNAPKDVKTAAFCRQIESNDISKASIQTTRYGDSRVCSDEVLTRTVTSNPQIDSKNCCSEEERVCPICEAVFPRVFSQREFESHVVAHLEAESASLLDQYEIL